ncbi:amidohydrolase [Paraburkholderia sp. RP-4-7]|uniref:Amidohydrolase n=1 Tax=Paraburkholderia polaris TaxID=2728848 RepID=A0A848IVH7_9BURK|nr:amidohydrolase family protein [Paraburkholderia polaris]NMM04085.1 amidohydrolase [Paraburkholderia polaris]
MKIICVEEHTVDAAIAKASQQGLAAEAGYMADWGSRVEDKPPAFGDLRPSLVPPKHSMELARDLGAGRIADMDKHGIDMQILSYSSSPQLAPAAEVVGLTRAANDRLAEAIQANPARFGGFASLPWQDPDAAALELERTVKELGFKGTLLTGRPGKTFLDDPRYEPVLATLNELKVPIYVHPGFPLSEVREPYYGGLGKEVSARLSLFGWGWHHEAGIQVIRMMLSGQFDKFPNLQVISGHWGEMVPFYLQRMDDTIPQEATGLSRSITDTYKSHVYVTPSGMFNLPHFEFIHKVVGAGRIIYAVDYPYLTHTGSREFLDSLPISQEDKEKIAYRNAEALFRL